MKFHLDPLSDFFASFLLAWGLRMLASGIGHDIDLRNQRNVFKIAVLICNQYHELNSVLRNVRDLRQAFAAFVCEVTWLLTTFTSSQQLEDDILECANTCDPPYNNIPVGSTWDSG